MGRSRSLNGVRRSHCLLSKFTGNIGWLSVSVPVASALTGLAPIPSLRWGQPHKPVSTSLWRGCVRIPLLPPGYCYRPLDFFYQPGGHSYVLGNDMFSRYPDAYSPDFKCGLRHWLISRQISFRKIVICKYLTAIFCDA